MLSKQTDVAALVGNRIYPIAFMQGCAYPALVYNTRGITAICRDKDGPKTGQLEIGMLAATPLELQTLVDTVNDTLIDYGGVHLATAIRVEANDDDFNEAAPEIKGFFKAIQFDFTITKQNT